MERITPFNPAEVGKLFRPEGESKNGQITIIGGSELFHGAPLLSLKTASRIVDMVYFSSPDPSVGEVANVVKSKLFSFIWVPWEDVDKYIEKSDAVLIGPGLMRYRKEIKSSELRIQNFEDEAWTLTRQITKELLTGYPDKKWVIDAGSLQVMEKSWIPPGDTLAGLTVALFAKNEASLAASCASYITKTAGDELYGKVRTNFNADDLASKVPEVLGRFQK